MKINFLIISIIFIPILQARQITLLYNNESICITGNESSCINEKNSNFYEWAIVGAGVAGVTALAVLLKSGVEPSSVVWIDPEFNIGRMGKYYRNVPGNVQTHRLILYVDTCPYFKEISSSSFSKLYACNQDEFQPLYVIVDPLIDFTRYLCNKVTPIKDTIVKLDYQNDYWFLQGINHTINAKKVILAIGAHPKRLDYNIPEIPLDDALDKEKLIHYIKPSDSIAVFGGMHSAILILKYLSECSVNRIVNFYSHPYFYDVPGLEGATAQWAQTVLEQNKPENLIRLINTQENRERELPSCTKAIYAIGFEPNPILINGTSNISFDENTGIIDQNLYGIGMAFPPTGIFNGLKIAKNGLHTYLNYAKKLIPLWITEEKCHTAKPEYSLTDNAQEELPWI